jgi:hypothetical protein
MTKNILILISTALLVTGFVFAEAVVDKIKDKQKDAQFILVKKADLVMFDDGNGVIEPALFVQGEVNEDGTTFPCDWMVPVLTDPKAKY